ncbi:hypothetical protein [Cellulomonas telluris]|uniref:hypothetical protein n=1 Tax=Cellulomonas telluris TaxID=2306636 RepID=UPI0010A8D1C5|nr:hypothetical protein [Cellulomonas telluris]
MTLWVSRASGEGATFLDLDPAVITLVGKIAILGTQLEDQIYKICDALALDDCRAVSATAAADRFKKKARQEDGLPPWARVESSAVVACCSVVKSALDERNNVIHATYFNRLKEGVWEPSSTRTSGLGPMRPIDPVRYQRICDSLLVASRQATDVWFALLPLLAPQIYDLRFGPHAGEVLILREDGKWAAKPSDAELTKLRAQIEMAYPPRV